MSRIDAMLGVALGEGYRPPQAAQNIQLQSQQAASQSIGEPAGAPVTSDDLRAAAEQLKRVIEKASGRKMSFQFDDHEQLYVEITDESGQVVFQLPSKEVRRLREGLSSMPGMVVDKQA